MLYYFIICRIRQKYADDSYLTVKIGDIRTVSTRRIQLNRKKKENEASHTGIHGTVVLMTYIYLALPMIIFLLGWCRPLVGIPLAGVCVWSLVLCFRKRENYIELDWELNQADKWRLVVIAAVIFVWVVLSGIGGYAWQNTDHAWRNRIFQILIDYRWSPTTAERGLVYYVGSWLPAALIGKLTDLDNACTAFFIWVLLGVFLVYALICIWRKRIVLWPLMILIFFSGLDIVGCYIFTDNKISVLGMEHLEWWTAEFPHSLQFTSNTSQLFWVFNQAIPTWLVMMLLFMDEPPKNMVWVGSLVAITSTLPFIGVLPILIYYMFRRSKWHRPESIGHGWKMVYQNMGGFQNLVGGGSVLIVSFLYLMGNDSFATISVAGTGGEDAPPTQLAIWFPWLLILAAVAVVVLLGTLVIWATERGKEYILRSMLHITAALVLLLLFHKYLWAGKSRENEIYRMAYTILFFLLEAGIYLYLLYRDVEDKGLYNVVLISLMIIPFIEIGKSNDFCMRASIPGLFIVMLWCIETLGKKRRNLRIVILTACLLIGSVSPVHEIKRALVNSNTEYVIEAVENERIFNALNFAGGLDTFFWRYMARQGKPGKYGSEVSLWEWDNTVGKADVRMERGKYESGDFSWRVWHKNQ